MSEKHKITLELTSEEIENLRGTLLKHQSAVTIEKVQREILKIYEEQQENS